MNRLSFNKDWTMGPSSGFFNMSSNQQPQPVTLPHDAMLRSLRAVDAPSGGKKGYFHDGSYDYIKKFPVPEDYKEKRVTFEFEGVYMNAMVYINGDYAGQHPYGYTNFYIKADRFLKYGQDNEIKVVVKSQDDSRWYTGTGIYRDTKIIITEQVHFLVDGIKITTPEITEERAAVVVNTVVQNEGVHPLLTQLITQIMDAEGNIVAEDHSPLTAFPDECSTVRHRLLLKHPKLWSDEHPYLYTCKSKLMNKELLLEEESTTFGIRSLSLDSEQGLCLNGEIIKLRGACIHHDNGILGAATIGRAEERRIEILKASGFNAVRCSHQPMSKAMLKACDKLGMLVMDESFDTWTRTKSDYDYALYFPAWWERDLEAMVNKDYNHPSVIMYSIGNEIPETGSANGAAWGRKLTEKIRSIDNSRYVINAVNGFVSVMDKVMKMMSNRAMSDVNTAMADAGDMMKSIQSMDFVTEATAESFAAVDIAGYNYADNRYITDKHLFPNRIICGSETFPKDIANNWRLVKANGHVIGDFTWTAWDYLGESGLGRVEYEETGGGHGVSGAYPWLTANCGDIDIIGNRLPVSFYREIVFGLRKEPYVAVQRPHHYGRPMKKTPWSWSDSLSSWSWNGFEGKPIKVEVYSDAEEIELVINGKIVGRAEAGEANAYKAEFDTIYSPGELTAVAYTGGRETGRTSLYSAGSDVTFRADLDRAHLSYNDEDLAFLTISLVDAQGILQPLADRSVTVTVNGPGVLQGMGSANPKNEESYIHNTHHTYDGKVLAVIRPTDAGSITVTIKAEECELQTITIEVA